jgi:DNA-binding NarL/FixJ family response regulator
VVGAIRTVASGGAVFGPGVARNVLARAGPSSRRGTTYDLTEREAEVLGLIAAGRNNPDIARELDITVKTVQNHVSRVLAKMHVHDRTQAALRARGL